MDTSETYIKMSDCPEIQSFWQCKSGDWFYAKEDLGDGNDKSFITKGEIVCNGDLANFCWESSCDFGGGIENFNSAVWLPRQDQLQEMVLTNHLPDELRKIIGYFNDFVGSVTPSFTSMEQLWLVFVMSEKHNKYWDGNEWKTK